MKETIFTTRELNFLLKLLKDRIESYQEEENVPTRYVQPLEETIGKLLSDWDNVYYKKHRTAINSCIGRYRNQLRSIENSYAGLSANEWLALTTEDKNEMANLDLCFAILEKTGEKKNSFRFSKIFDKIERLKKCDKIYLGVQGTDNLYKVAFVDNRDVMNWDLEGGVNIKSADFAKRASDSINSYAFKYGKAYSRADAAKVLENCRISSTPREHFDFVASLLN